MLNFKRNTMKTIKAFVILLAIGLSSFAAKAGDPLEMWEKNNPDASKALGEWAHSHKEAAKYIFEWDAQNPERSQELVTWAVEHPTEHLGKFHRQHKDWPELDEIERHHKPAMEDFLQWCHNYPDAARSLMEHSGALAWAGDHLWKESKRMEKN